MGNDTSAPLKYGQKLENDIKVTWKKSDARNSPPTIEGHCCCGVGNKAYVFGGVHTNSGEATESNQLYIYDTENESWAEAKCSGDIPARRTAATMTAVGSTLFLFGGLSQDSGWFDDVHAFDTTNNTWKLVTPEGKGPSPRDKLASAAIGDKIYYFGGFGPQQTSVDLEEDDDDEDDEDDEESETAGQTGAEFVWFNDLFILDTVANQWSSPMQMNLGVPTPRAAHAMCAVDKFLVIFGGKDTERRKNDLHIFDTETRKWVEGLTPSGREPEPRSFHCMAAVGHRLVVTGGRGLQNQHFADCHIFDTKTREWMQPALGGDLYAARGVHSTAVVGDSFMLFGGSGDFSAETMSCHTFYNDVYLCKTIDVLTGKAAPSENQENVAVDSNVPKAKDQGLPAANMETETA